MYRVRIEMVGTESTPNLFPVRLPLLRFADSELSGNSLWT